MQKLHTFQPQDLQEIINPLCNQKCFEASLSYGEELNLEFGHEHIVLETPKFTIKRGDWSLGTRGSHWYLTEQGKLLVSSHADTETVRKQITRLEEKFVTSYQVNTDGGLQIGFDQHYTLKICPDFDDPDFDDSEDALAYWELFTPNNKVLKVKPNSQGNIIWSYVPSDVPMTS